MMHVALGCFKLIQTIQLLSLRQRSQSCHITNLRLSAGKHGRTMYSRYNINLSSQWANLRNPTTVRPFMILQNHLTNRLLLILVYCFSKYCQPLFIFGKCFCQTLCNHADIFFSCLFIISKDCNLHLFRRNDLANCCKQLFRNCTALISVLFFSASFHNLIDKLDNLLIHFMCFKDCIDHLLFRQLIRSGFNHNYFFSCRSYRQRKI